MNKQLYTYKPCLVFVFMVILFSSCFNKEPENYLENLYFLSTPGKLIYFDDAKGKPAILSIPGGYDFLNIRDEKVYVTIRGNSRESGKEVFVVKGNDLVKKIPLTYGLPKKVRYDPFTKYAYISHAGKITRQNENCITVIDTIKDVEIDTIMYNRCVEDICPVGDGTIIVSSWATGGGDYRLDVIEPATGEITSSLSLACNLTSIILAGNDILYGISSASSFPGLYRIDINQMKMISPVELTFHYPYKIALQTISGKERLYITHLNIDTNKGDGVTLFDPVKNKILGTIKKKSCPRNLFFKGRYAYICDTANNLVYITKENIIIESIPVEYPITGIALR